MRLSVFLLFVAVTALAQPRVNLIGRVNSVVVESFELTNGVSCIDAKSSLDTNVAWTPLKNFFIAGDANVLKLSPTNSAQFFRGVQFDLSPGRRGFTNLTQAYSLLTTVAGAGGSTEAINKWLPAFEGGPATQALLSRPHIAVGDPAGNIFIADKDSHAVRKVLPNGNIVTVAGITQAGNGSDELMRGTNVAMTEPNGLWVNSNGVVYILDLGNGKIRRLDTNGMMSTFITVPGGIAIGRGLWVNESATLAFIASGSVVKKWSATNGVTDYATGFVELANLIVDPQEKLVVTDRRTHSVYRLGDDGTRTVIAGNGTTFGGGDGELATATGLNEVRGVWFLPTGGYFLCTHRGSQVWYVDTGGYIHLFLHGLTSDTHAGDGTYFYNPTEPRVSEIRAVTVDFEGNLLITEHDSGYVRKVRFLRRAP